MTNEGKEQRNPLQTKIATNKEEEQRLRTKTEKEDNNQSFHNISDIHTVQSRM